MAITFTPNAQLQKPANNDRNWDAALNANTDAVDAVNSIGKLMVTSHELPSTTLTVKVSGGSFLATDSTVATYAGTGSLALTLSTTQHVWLTNAGTLTTGTTWPATAHVRLATVVLGATAVTSITDERICLPICTTGGYLLLSGGTLTDGANLVVGSSTGTQMATATTQKLGFYGKTPVVQQTGGAASATGTWTATEQAMLNAVYSMARAMGLLS